MAQNVVTAGNLALGPADLYIGQFGATEPTDAAVTAAPPSGFTGVGGTLNAVTFTLTPTYKELTVDQIVYDIERRLTNMQITVATQLAEVTMSNLSYSLNNTSNATTGTTAFNAMELPVVNSGVTPNYVSLLFDGWGPNGKRRRVIVRKCLSTAAVGTADSKDGQKVYPVTWTAHYVSSAINPFHVVDSLV